MRKFLFVFALLISLLSLPAHAVALETHLESQESEQRAQNLFKEVRCMVCSGESISDSRADLARDLRKVIREKIKNGQTTENIKNSLVASYGDTILMRPALSNSTWLLWFGPALMLIVGIFVSFAMLRKRKAAGA